MDALRSADESLRKLLARRTRPDTAEPNAFAGSRIVPRRDYYQIADERARQLLWTLQQAHADQDPAAAQAAQEWLALNPCEDDYARQLEQKCQQYTRTAMGDVLRLALVRVREAQSQEGAPQRRQALAALAGNPRSPACVQANFELGEMLMRTALPQPGLRTPSDYFQAVLDAGESPWKELAAQRLAALSGPKEPG